MADGPLFHGSKALLGVGTVIEPRSRSYAFASRSLATARVFGPWVYEVAALGPVVERAMPYTGDEDHREVICDAGFVIVRDVLPDEVPMTEEPADVIARFLAEGGYESIEAWALDSDYVLVHDDAEPCWVDEDDRPVNIPDCLLAAIDASRSEAAL